jgi:hypothetical protein
MSPQKEGSKGVLMRQKQARTLIIREWDRWLQTHSSESGGPTGRETLKFFFELQDARSPLLDFQSRGRDKWRIIHTWLLSERLENAPRSRQRRSRRDRDLFASRLARSHRQ